MQDESFQPILDRKTTTEDVNEHFHEQIKLLQEIVNYGSNLIPRCFNSSNRDLPAVIVLVALLKQVVAMLDATEILVAQGAVYSANVSVRSLFEAFLYIEWILKEDTERRARQYFVWNLRIRRKWARYFIKGSDEHRQVSQMGEKFSYSLSEKMDDLVDNAIQQSDSIDKLLSKDEYVEIDREFERLKQDRKRKHDVPWYKPWGPNSISDMASRLGREAEYHVFYTQYSQIMHASSLLHHVKFGYNSITFEPIRKLDQIEIILHTAINFSTQAYRVILGYYRPAELTNFSRKYLSEWRNRLRSIKKVKYRTQAHYL